MLTQSIHNSAGGVAIKAEIVGGGLLAKTDWTAISLWVLASLVAVSLLAAAMNRRRTALTEALKKHVVDTIGPIGGDEEEVEKRE